MQALIETRFKPAWWLSNRHLQTIWPALFRHIDNPPCRSERLTTPDGDFVDLGWCGGTRGPLIILMHGLAGNARSGYIDGMRQALREHGFRSVSLNFRGSSGEPNRKAHSYHSGETSDIDFLFRTLIDREPDTPIGAVGYSLGGNVLLKWLGERGDALSLFAAVTVSVPLVLSLCADQMERGFSRFYRDRLVGDLKKALLLKKSHLQKNSHPTELERLCKLGDLSSIRSFWEFDDQVIASLHSFKDVHDYYAKCSSRQFLPYISIPTLLIQSMDDPFMSPGVIPTVSELSPETQLEVTNGGGHVGFISGSIPGQPVYWLEKRIPEYLLGQLQDNQTLPLFDSNCGTHKICRGAAKNASDAS